LQNLKILFFDIGIEKNDLNIMAKEEIDFLEKNFKEIYYTGISETIAEMYAKVLLP
jgi:hypothetical protein